MPHPKATIKNVFFFFLSGETSWVASKYLGHVSPTPSEMEILSYYGLMNGFGGEHQDNYT